jgi:hypothetical protein
VPVYTRCHTLPYFSSIRYDEGGYHFNSTCPALSCFCVKVTDAVLEKVAAGCPNLTPLNFHYCTNVTDAEAEWRWVART